MKRVAAALRAQGSYERVVCAYLEINTPSLEQAISRTVRQGIDEVRVLPYFLLAGRHVLSDIPAIVTKARKDHGRKVKIKLCPYLGYHEKIVSVARQRVGQAR